MLRGNQGNGKANEGKEWEEKIGQVGEKTETKEFTFHAVSPRKVSRNQFVVIKDKEDSRTVISQVKEIEKRKEKELIRCRALREIEGDQLLPVRRPVSVASPVYLPSSDQLSAIFTQIPKAKRLHLGSLLDHPGVAALYNVEDFSTHLFVVASTGGGKSYTLGVFMEELLEQNSLKDAAILIFDFHNEFGGLALPNQNEEQVSKLQSMNLEPTGYEEKLLVFNWQWNPIKLSPIFTPDRLKFLSNMPEEYSLFLKTLMEEEERALDLTTLKERVTESDLHHARKNAIESRIEGLQRSGLFSESYFQAKDLIEPGKASLIQLGKSGREDWIVRFIVADILRDLYKAKLDGELPSNVILFLDEAHKFAPRSGDDPLGKIIHTITREGRKLGLWLVLSTQTSQDLSAEVMKNCNSLLALRSPERQMRTLSRIYGISREKADTLSDVGPGKGYLKTLSLPFPLMIDVRPRKTCEMPKTGRLREKIQKKVKAIALSTKDRLLYQHPKEDIKGVASERKKVALEEIAKTHPLSVEGVKELVSELDEVVLPTPHAKYCYARGYWEHLKEEARQLLAKKGRSTTEDLRNELDLPRPIVKELLAQLDVECIKGDIWYSKRNVKEVQRSITKMVSNQQKVPLSLLSNTFDIPKGEIEIFLKRLQGKIVTLNSNMVYAPSFLAKMREKVQKRIKKRLFISQKGLQRLVDLPPADLQPLIEDSPLVHLQTETVWYWQPKLKDLEDKVMSFKKRRGRFTLEEVQEALGIPREDVKAFVKHLNLEGALIQKQEEQAEPHQELAEKVLREIRELSMAKRYLIKTLLRNDGHVSTSKIFDRVDERVILSLKSKKLIDGASIKGEDVIRLRLDRFLKHRFGMSVDREMTKKVEKELYKKMRPK